MKKTSGKHRKHTNKRKQHDCQPASLHPTFPPQPTSLPYVTPTHQTSLPPTKCSLSTSLSPGFPSLSTSLPPSFFSIPPCEPIQNNSTASYGKNISLPDNIVPAPRINSSSSGHISQNGISSSLLQSSTQAVSPASSTPSMSRSNIGVPIPESPSLSSSITAPPACSKTKNTGEIRQYNAFHRLIITPDEDGLKEYPYNILEQIWNHFKTKLKGEEVSSVGMFEETHKKRNKDGTRGEWVEPRAEETFETEQVSQ
ncbi:hypothetical protein KY290_024942 [Solanum tuberosum]|uniref:Hydroxyproline-rich glycoprotein family protein n=1 Tax=Solanum tuberosum TaxID=4113 RepID=A0ABQ7UU43_SOLTU|nr:hypothetical protein KY284_023798 [Solanum tuberosum]KAH0754672.1 hypothetical protein KY290_024942 [Solanum tuberosum]